MESHPRSWGSLGFEYRSNEDWEPSDIDIHVSGDPRGWEAPDHLRIYDWEEDNESDEPLRLYLGRYSEHEFQKDDVSVEFGSIDSLPDFAGVSKSDIELIHLEDITFRVPSLETVFREYIQGFPPKIPIRNDHNNN